MDYCIAQCSAKLLGRLKVKVPDTNIPFLEAFDFELEKSATSEYLSLPKKSDAVPASLVGDEKVHLDGMNRNTKRYLVDARDFQFKLDRNRQIELDRDSYAHYHAWVNYLLEVYKTKLQVLLRCRAQGKHDDEAKAEFQQLIKNARLAASDLGDMCHRTACFQLYIRSGPVKRRFQLIKVCSIIKFYIAMHVRY